MDAWDEIRPALMSRLLDYGFSKEEAVSFLVAGEEIYANIVMHAFGEGFGKDDVCIVEMDAAVGDERKGATLTFTDSGPYFDPTKHKDRKPVTAAKGLQPGGFGITIAKGKCDEMAYCREDGLNRLSLFRYIR